MQPLLENINSVADVVGSMVCAPDGRMLSHAFPATFDEPSLRKAAAVVADGAAGLETATGPVRLLDLRYEEGRVVVKPLAGGLLLLLLCTKAVNLQLLLMSVSVASKKLEQLAAAPQDAQAPAPERPAGPEKPTRKTKWWPSV